MQEVQNLKNALSHKKLFRQLTVCKNVEKEEGKMGTPIASVASVPTKGVVSRIVGIFTSPRAVMEDIVAHPNWLIPLIIVLMLGMTNAYLFTDLGMQAGIEQVRNNPKMTQEQIDVATKAMQERMASPWRYVGIVAAPIFIVVACLLIAGVFLFSGNVLLGGEAKFKTIFSVVSWSSLIGVLAAAVNVPIMLAKQSLEEATSLSVLLSPDDKNTFLYKLLSKVEIFTIWEIAVMGIGLAVAYKFSTGKATGIVVAWWLIYVLISVGLSTLFGGMMFGG